MIDLDAHESLPQVDEGEKIILTIDSLEERNDFVLGFLGCLEGCNVILYSNTKCVDSLYFAAKRSLFCAILPFVSTLGDRCFAGSGLRYIYLGEYTGEDGAPHVFSGCDYLEKVDCRELTQINDSMFKACVRLISLTSRKVCRIMVDAFVRCSLTSITMDADRMADHFIEEGALAFSNIRGIQNLNPERYSIYWSEDVRKDVETFVLIDRAEKTLLYLRSTDGFDLTDGFIRENVLGKSDDDFSLERIGDNACTTMEMSAIGDVHLDGLVSIGKGGMRNSGIHRLVAPDLRIVDTSAFQSCTSLWMVDAPLLNEVKEYSFLGCTSLLVFRPILHKCTLGKMAFCHCSSLSSMEFRDDLHCHHDSFDDCDRLELVCCNS